MSPTRLARIRVEQVQEFRLAGHSAFAPFDVETRLVLDPVDSDDVTLEVHQGKLHITVAGLKLAGAIQPGQRYHLALVGDEE